MTPIKPWLLISTALILPVQGVIALERAPDKDVHYYPRTNVPTNSGITNPGGTPSGSWSNNPSNHWVNGPSWRHRPGYWRYPNGYWRGRWGYWGGGWRGYWGPPPRYYWGSSCWDCGIGSALVGLTFGGIAPPVVVNSLPPPLPLPEPLIERDAYEGCQSITVKGIPYYNCEGRDNRNRDGNRHYQDDSYSDRADSTYEQESYQGRYDQRYEDDIDQDSFDNDEAPYRNNPFSRALPYDNNGWEAK